ncbi:MAG: hypothetical protein AB7O04_07350 [Hyphomonadaceae bacterium]
MANKALTPRGLREPLAPPLMDILVTEEYHFLDGSMERMVRHVVARLPVPDDPESLKA